MKQKIEGFCFIIFKCVQRKKGYFETFFETLGNKIFVSFILTS